VAAATAGGGDKAIAAMMMAMAGMVAGS